MTDLVSLLEQQEERLSHCVHCGFCLPVCPTYVRLKDENDSPRGRLHLMRAVAEGRLETDSHAFRTHIDRCLGCRACETVCPSGVEYGVLLERAREDVVQVSGQGHLTRLLLSVFASKGLRSWALGLARVLRSSRIPGLVARWAPGWSWLRTPRLGLAMLAATRPSSLPKPLVAASTAETFGGGRTGAEEKGRGRVGVLTGCVQDGLYRRVNEATRRVLVANGWEVVQVPSQGCCGALHAHSGDLEGARSLARANIRAFSDLGLDFIVVNAAGCGAAMKEYSVLLEEDEGTGLAHGFAGQVRDLTELLTETGLRIGAPIAARVTLDHPCHLVHAQGIRGAPEEMLHRGVPELELVPLVGADECCGGAGIYGLTHPELGGKIGRDKIDAVVATGAEMALSANPGCMMQIGAGLLLRGSQIGVLHPVELLDESYRRAGLYEA